MVNEKKGQIKFELNEKELETVEIIKKSVETLFGDLGDITYSFNVGGGIGRGVKITFEKYKITKDITDYDSW